MLNGKPTNPSRADQPLRPPRSSDGHDDFNPTASGRGNSCPSLWHSVNRVDLLVRAGKLRIVLGHRFPRGLGLDFAGEIAQLGKVVTDLDIGTGVWDSLESCREPQERLRSMY